MTARKTAAPSTNLPVKISNPDKIFWPDEGYTRLDLVAGTCQVIDLFPNE